MMAKRSKSKSTVKAVLAELDNLARVYRKAKRGYRELVYGLLGQFELKAEVWHGSRRRSPKEHRLAAF